MLVPAEVRVPATSPDSTDAGGRTTSYAAANLLDGDPATAWRTEGDAGGLTLTFTFARQVRIDEVGLVNGMAKVDPHDGTDRYPQGRRVLAVTWAFTGPAGTTTVHQDLADGVRELQSVPVPPVEATRVDLTLTGVSAPGAGRAFDRTAVGEVRFTGGA
ncbi:hypothetical protein GTQ99_10615 [Kineococcus sp. T13]|nr:hypothetical protein [Kineococcus vitellinus]